MQDLITFISNHWMLTTSIIGVVFLLFIVEFWRIRKTLGGMTPQAAIQLINHEHATIIDIRDANAFKQGHIVHAHNISPEDAVLDKKLDKFKQKPVLVVCYAGVSCQGVAQQLNKKGFKAYSLQGGMKAWYDAKLPTVKETHHG